MVNKRMNREIKFRVWCPAGKFYFEWSPAKYWELHGVSQEPLVFEQFTGFKDKNEKDIYEGDIIKGFNNLFVVKWGVIKRTVVDSFQNFQNVDIPCFYFEDLNGEKLFPIVRNFKGEHDLQTLEIISNIHEMGKRLKNALQL